MTQTVVIETIISESPYGGAIFSAYALKGGEKHRFVANADVMPRTPEVGEIWDVTGTQINHPKYGKQVKTTAAIPRLPTGHAIIDTISKSKAFPGIGPKKAEALWTAFGDGLYTMLDACYPKDEHRADPFVDVLGELAEVLVDGWLNMAIEADVYRWLDTHGLPVNVARKIIIIYGNDAVEKLDDNPYRLLAFLPWQQTDVVATALGVPKDDERRLIAAADAAVYRRLNFSHTATDEGEFVDLIMRFLGCDPGTAQKALYLALDASAVVRLGDTLQGLGPASMERFIAERSMLMMRCEFTATNPTIRRAPDDDQLQSIFDDFKASEGISLNQAQREAVKIATSSSISLLSGGAGVGKTVTLKAIYNATQRCGGAAPIQMALAGRAAKRMTEATGKPAMTIQKFLNDVDKEKIVLDMEQIIIVDEASMLDLPTTYRIMRRMEPGSRLLLVGDSAQLPPIGFGLVHGIFCDDENMPQVELTEVHRQAAETGIPQASIAVRNGEVPELDNFAGKGTGVSFIEADKDQIVDVIEDVIRDLSGDEVQIIGPVKGGAAGTQTINAFFHDGVDQSISETGGFAEGEPVIWTVNNYDLDLMNGSLGKVINATDFNNLIIDFDGEQKVIPFQNFRDMEHAYAITVHKAQGSQFTRVVVPVFGNKLLDRTLLYTAITRAQLQVVLVGDRKDFEQAVIDPPHPSLRQTGLQEYLQP